MLVAEAEKKKFITADVFSAPDILPGFSCPVAEIFA